MKRLLLIIGIVVSFFVGYSISAKAYPSPWPYGRAPDHGYFTDAVDSSGWEVLNQYCNNGFGSFRYNNGRNFCNSIPLSVNSAASFIAFIEDRLANGAPGGSYGDPRARTGAAFIVQTMIGSSRNRPPTAAEMNTWRTLVTQYAAAGRVNWNTSAHSFTLNTFYQGTDNNPSPNDDAFYDAFNTGAAIVFYNSSGGVAYALRRECANPVGQGNLAPLPPPIDFNLTPSVSASATTGSEGDQVTFTYSVANGGPTVSNLVGCTALGNTRAPGWSPLPQQDVARTSDPAFVGPPTNCPRTFSVGGPQQVASEIITLGNLAPGTRVCRSLVINPRDEVGGPRTSAESCVLIAKTPYVRFMGNDVWAGGGFASVNPACNISAKITTVGRTLTSGAKAGSVGEYHAFALDQITSFGSAGHVLSQYGAVGDVSRMLTFANSEPTVSRLGYYGAAAHCINDYTANYVSAPAIAPGTYAVNGRGSGTWRIPGNLTLNGTMPAGGQQVYYATGDVTINANLTYPAAYANFAAIPSLVVITTGNIYVAPNVTQLDGVFIARGDGVGTGVFYTCWPKNEPVSVTHPCNANQLTVNGAVAAARLDLLRSFGATGATDALRQDPGEVFMFSPEVYLRNALSSSSSPTAETMNLLDLPPRF
jgi:hypothetical protein